MVETKKAYDENIRKICDNDDFGLRGAIPYIYIQGRYWFIAHWKTEEKAKNNCPEGYSCNKSTTVAQKPYC